MFLKGYTVIYQSIDRHLELQLKNFEVADHIQAILSISAELS
jgi:hypothetical protein